jgi:hypothetical protein
MNIINRPNLDSSIGWDQLITFDFYDRDIVINREIENAHTVCEWVSNTFANNFVILEYGHKRIAGGYVDNKGGWDFQNDPDLEKDKDYVCRYIIDSYELRCTPEDATMFLLKYTKGKL